MKKKEIDVECKHLDKVNFLYMDGYYCNTCKNSFIKGKWTINKKKKNEKRN